jgi:hypothetical protein
MTQKMHDLELIQPNIRKIKINILFNRKTSVKTLKKRYTEV